jgi:hypothetical protein
MTAAVATMLAVAAAGLAVTVGLLVAAASFEDRYLRLVRSTDADPTEARQAGELVRRAMGGAAVVSLLLAAVTVLLALGLHRRSPVARVATWAAVPFALLVSNLMVVGALASAGDFADADADVTGQVVRAVQDALPGWLPVLLTGAAMIEQLGYILVAVLLLMPPANRFFRAAGQPSPITGVAPWPPSPYPLNPPVR